jgi:hypothetical protein
MGYSAKNYITNFHKEELPEKILEKIGEVLKIDIAIFQGKAHIKQSETGGINYSVLYERLLKEKDKRIEMLEQQLLQMSEQLRKVK